MGHYLTWKCGWETELKPVFEFTWGPEWEVNGGFEFPKPGHALQWNIDWGMEWGVEYSAEYGVEWGPEWGVEYGMEWEV